jgi:hypothetical protein
MYNLLNLHPKITKINRKMLIQMQIHKNKPTKLEISDIIIEKMIC